MDGANVFPGAWALVPVSGAALVLVATASVPAGRRTPAAAPARGVERLLDSAPLLFGARISYALYLWHWPILIFWLLTTDTRQVGPMAAGTILTASTVLAWLTTRYVAEPLLTRVTHRLAAPRALATGAAPRLRGVTSRTGTTPSGRRTLVALTGAAVLVLGAGGGLDGLDLLPDRLQRLELQNGDQLLLSTTARVSASSSSRRGAPSRQDLASEA